MKKLECDYLIVGSGAVGMAFADVICEESEASIVIVDRYAKPGGHWNVAYPFVTLHQPSQFYGVNSRELSKGRIDQIGLNKGLSELATGAEVSSYYDDVMRHQLLPSGRVQYFPMCDYKGDKIFISMVSGEEYIVKVDKKIVDATYLKTNVPATHTPNFTIGDEISFIPINDLVHLTESPSNYVVIGGGKTGIDACLWLLEQGVIPDNISWIVSRDAWLLDRQNTQPTAAYFKQTIGAQAAQFEAIAEAQSIRELFDKLENAGVLVRIDKSVTPSMFHGATVSQLELEELRKIDNVIRLGRVKSIEQSGVILEQGSLPHVEGSLYIDCSASAISNLETKPIFSGELITPQTVRSYQPVFSAAFIAHVELSYDGDQKKNELCQVVPLPNHDTDWIVMMSAMMTNQFNWGQDKDLRKWLYNNRLDGFSKLVADTDRRDAEKMTVLKRIRASMMPAAMNIQQLISSIEK